MLNNKESFEHKARECGISEHLIPGLFRYVVQGVIPGSCLQAILKGDLMNAVLRADSDTLLNLRALCLFIYNEIPHRCWGAEWKLQAWAALPQEERNRQLL